MVTLVMPTASSCIDRRLLDGVCIYQDLMLGGKVAVVGRRDCNERWELIAPHLPRRGAVLDVGSNLGWFGLRLCEAFPDVVVASVEADPRSAALQRLALAAADHRRVALLTSPANVRLVHHFARHRQRFAAVLCLSVLHWLPRHREFLALLGRISERLLIEHPDPREPGAGHEYLRREIGDIGPYLQSLFAGRPVRCLGNTAGYRTPEYPRSLWFVGPTDGGQQDQEASASLNVACLLAGGLSWPPRAWWRAEVQSLPPRDDAHPGGAGLWLTPRGLVGSLAGLGGLIVRARLQAVPQRAAFPWRIRLRHWAQAARRAARTHFWRSCRRSAV
jgi:SAM-dependent methyltransferase